MLSFDNLIGLLLNSYTLQVAISSLSFVFLFFSKHRIFRGLVHKFVRVFFDIKSPLKYSLLRTIWFAAIPFLCVLFLLVSSAILNRMGFSHQIVDGLCVMLSVYVLLRSIAIFGGNTEIHPILWLTMLCILVQEFNAKDNFIEFLSCFSFRVVGSQIFLYDVAAGIITTIILYWFVSLVLAVGQKVIKAINSDDENHGALQYKIFSYIMFIIALVALLTIIGVQSSHIAMFSSAIGVGVGFGLQRIAANFISGIMLLVEKTIQIGDILELDSGQIGTVKSLGVRAMVVTTFDGKDLIIPNESMTTQIATNYTLIDHKIRLSANFYIVNKKDVVKAIELMRRACIMQKGIHRKSPIVCCARDISERGVHLMSLFWISDFAQDDILEIKSGVISKTVSLMEENGIELYFEKSLGLLRDTLNRATNLHDMPSSPFVNRFANRSGAIANQNTKAEDGNPDIAKYSD